MSHPKPKKCIKSNPRFMLSRMTEISTNLSDFKAAVIVIVIIFPFNEPEESMKKI